MSSCVCVCVCACEVLRVFIWIISHLAAQRKEVRTVDHNNSMMDRLYTQKATHEHAHTPKHTGTPLWATCLHVVNLSSECHLIKVNNQDYDHWSLDHETRIWGWVLFEHYKISEHFFYINLIHCSFKDSSFIQNWVEFIIYTLL